jgi:hypothetical protein
MNNLGPVQAHRLSEHSPWRRHLFFPVVSGPSILYVRAHLLPSLWLGYRASQMDCDGCAMEDRCCPNMQFRKIVRRIHEAAQGEARRIAVTPEYKQSRRQRKKVEMLFAHLKRILKLDRFRLRDPSGAHDEFLMAQLRKICEEWPSGSRLKISRQTKRPHDEKQGVCRTLQDCWLSELSWSKSIVKARAPKRLFQNRLTAVFEGRPGD